MTKSFLRRLTRYSPFLFAILASRPLLNLIQRRRPAVSGENERIFRALVTNLPGIVFVLNECGIITLVGGSGLKAIGVNGRRFVGRPIHDLYPDHPQILDDCRRALAGESLMSSVEMVGLAFDVWYSPFLDEDTGRIRGVIGIATDVTERRRAEDLLQYQASLLQSVSDAIIAVDMDFRVQSWNEAAEDMYGWYMDEAAGKRLSELIAVEAQEWEADLLRRTRESGFWKAEIRQRGKSGADITAFVSASVLIDDDGRAIGLVILSRDITDLKRAEAQALELAIERERIRMLRDFIGDASHDFRTPLSTIHTSLYLLRKKHPELAKPHLDVIDAQTRQISRLVEDLLTLSRLDSTINFEFARANIGEFATGVVTALRPLAEKRGHTLTCAGPETPGYALINAPELHRALTNIVVNAINYTPTGGTITVETEATAAEVAIHVRDTGIGIASSDLTHIFDRFYRVDKARAVETGGTGLGLSIAGKVVEIHHGRITVESTPGQGSVFTIWLPSVATT